MTKVTRANRVTRGFRLTRVTTNRVRHDRL